MLMRLLAYFSGIALVLMVLVSSALFFALGTERGTQRVLAILTQHIAPSGLSFERVEGTLWHTLVLHGVSFELAEHTSTIQYLKLDWQPSLLWQRHLKIAHLSVEGSELYLPVAEADKDSATKTPIEGFRLPPLPFSFALNVTLSHTALHLGDTLLLHIEQGQLDLHGDVEDYTLALDLIHTGLGFAEGHLHTQLSGNRDGVTLQTLAGQILTGTMQATGTIHWQHGVHSHLQAQGQGLDLTYFADDLPHDLQAQVDGHLHLLRTDLLAVQELSLSVQNAHALHGKILLNGELDWSQGLRVTAVTDASIMGINEHWEAWPHQAALLLNGGLHVDWPHLAVSNLLLQHADLPFAVWLDGGTELAESWRESVLEVSVRWQDLHWPLSAESLLVSSPRGQLHVSGTLEDFALSVSTTTHGFDLPAMDWQLTGRGSDQGLMFEHLQGTGLGGELSASGDVYWLPELRWDLSLTLTNLDPSMIDANWPTHLSLRTHSVGSMPDVKNLHAKLELHQASIDIAGHQLDVQGDFIFKEAQLHIPYAHAASRDGAWTLQTQQGQWHPTTSDSLFLVEHWQLDVDPARLLPTARGHITAHGQLKGPLLSPTLTAELEGMELALEAWQLETIRLKLELDAHPKGILQWALSAENFSDQDQIILKSAHMTATGSLQAHDVTLDLKAPEANLQAALKGGLGLEDLNWQGQLHTLALNVNHLRPWHLQTPASLTLHPEHAALQGFCMLCPDCVVRAIDAKTQICADVSWTQHRGIAMDASLAALPIGLFHPGISGIISGHLRGQMDTDGALNLDSQLALSSGIVIVPTGLLERRIAHEGGWLTLLVNQEGLVAELSVLPLTQGRMQAWLSMPGFQHWPPAPAQPIDARWQAILPDLSIIQGFVPDITHVQGMLTADVLVAGSVLTPRISGAVELREAAADIPLLGIALRDINLLLSPDVNTAQQLHIHGGLSSGDGTLALAGYVDWSRQFAALTIGVDETTQAANKAFSLINTPDIRAAMVPRMELEIDLPSQVLAVTGEIFIPTASITPKIGIAGGSDDTPTAVVASPDVVIRKKDDAIAQIPATSWRLQTDLNIVLGRTVIVDAVGFKSRLGGHVRLQHKGLDNGFLPLAEGIFYVLDGTFRAFGQDLLVEWGRIIFDGGELTTPELDIQAIRWIRGDDPSVEAVGVLLTGPLDRTRIELFSRPTQLDAISIRAYLISGHQLGQGGLILGHGAYLGEALYVAYGLNLLEGTHEFNLRYDILRQLGFDIHISEADKTFSFSYIFEH